MSSPTHYRTKPTPRPTTWDRGLPSPPLHTEPRDPVPHPLGLRTCGRERQRASRPTRQRRSPQEETRNGFQDNDHRPQTRSKRTNPPLMDSLVVQVSYRTQLPARAIDHNDFPPQEPNHQNNVVHHDPNENRTQLHQLIPFPDLIHRHQLAVPLRQPEPDTRTPAPLLQQRTDEITLNPSKTSDRNTVLQLGDSKAGKLVPVYQ